MEEEVVYGGGIRGIRALREQRDLLPDEDPKEESKR